MTVTGGENTPSSTQNRFNNSIHSAQFEAHTAVIRLQMERNSAELRASEAATKILHTSEAERTPTETRFFNEFSKYRTALSYNTAWHDKWTPGHTEVIELIKKTLRAVETNDMSIFPEWGPVGPAPRRLGYTPADELEEAERILKRKKLREANKRTAEVAAAYYAKLAAMAKGNTAGKPVKVIKKPNRRSAPVRPRTPPRTREAVDKPSPVRPGQSGAIDPASIMATAAPPRHRSAAEDADGDAAPRSLLFGNEE